jgi:hypothetical protein
MREAGSICVSKCVMRGLGRIGSLRTLLNSGIYAQINLNWYNYVCAIGNCFYAFGNYVYAVGNYVCAFGNYVYDQ